VRDGAVFAFCTNCILFSARVTPGTSGHFTGPSRQLPTGQAWDLIALRRCRLEVSLGPSSTRAHIPERRPRSRRRCAGVNVANGKLGWHSPRARKIRDSTTILRTGVTLSASARSRRLPRRPSADWWKSDSVATTYFWAGAPPFLCNDCRHEGSRAGAAADVDGWLRLGKADFCALLYLLCGARTGTGGGDVDRTRRIGFGRAVGASRST